MVRTPLTSGNIVNLLDDSGELIADKDGNPLLYQVLSVYRDRGRASLVSSYGEYVGLHPIKDIIYVSEGPIFTGVDYKEGDIVSWIEDDSAYEGKISKLYDNHAIIVNIKKLMPIDQKAKIPYWKIYNDQMSEK